MSAYLTDLALKGAELYPNEEAVKTNAPIRGSALESLVAEYLQAHAVISRLGNVLDTGVLLAIAAGTELSLENSFDAQESARRLEREMRDPNVKVEAQWNEEEEKHILKVHRMKHGNAKTTTVLPEFILSADYQKLRESSRMLQGVIGEGARVKRDKDEAPVKNFAEVVNWLMRQAEKGLSEMTPEQLRDTTMDPKVRRMLRVRIEDAANADAIFSMLMGDIVEPRRAFIESNALFGNIDT